MTIGIYKITDNYTGKFYIGQSKKCEYRWQSHAALLFFNKHYNWLLQDAVDNNPDKLYGFTFEVIDECELKDLNIKEKEIILDLKPELNIYLYSNIRSVKNFVRLLKAYIDIYKNNSDDIMLSVYSDISPIFKVVVENLDISLIEKLEYSESKILDILKSKKIKIE